MKIWKDFTIKELLSLPRRDWGEISEYESILIVKTRRMHCSGYNWFAVVGCKDGSFPNEIAAMMDVLRLDTDLPFAVDVSPYGVIRLHSLGRARDKLRFFKVEYSLKTTIVSTGKIVNNEQKKGNDRNEK